DQGRERPLPDLLLTADTERRNRARGCGNIGDVHYIEHHTPFDARRTRGRLSPLPLSPRSRRDRSRPPVLFERTKSRLVPTQIAAPHFVAARRDPSTGTGVLLPAPKRARAAARKERQAVRKSSRGQLASEAKSSRCQTKTIAVFAMSLSS